VTECFLLSSANTRGKGKNATCQSEDAQEPRRGAQSGKKMSTPNHAEIGSSSPFWKYRTGGMENFAT